MSTAKTSLKVGNYTYPVKRVRIPNYMTEVTQFCPRADFRDSIGGNCGSSIINNLSGAVARDLPVYAKTGAPMLRISNHRPKPLPLALFFLYSAIKKGRDLKIMGLGTFPISTQYLLHGADRIDSGASPLNIGSVRDSRANKAITGGHLRAYFRDNFPPTLFVLEGKGVEGFCMSVAVTPPTLNPTHAGEGSNRGGRYTSAMVVNLAKTPKELR